MKLSAVKLRNAKVTGKAYKLPDGNGLYLNISKVGKKTWRYRYRFNHKETMLVLGEFPQMSLEVARKERAVARELLDQGKNPSYERKKEKQVYLAAIEEEKKRSENNFENLTLDWWEQQRGRWSKGHADAVLATLRHDAFPFIGEKSIEDITPPDILEILRSIEKRGALEIAGKVQQRITAVFRFAVQSGRITYNPAAEMKGVLKKKRVRHHPMIEVDELPDFLRTLSKARERDLHVITKLALRFTILTAARTGEVRFATWDEVDLEQKLWKIPAERMKMNAHHTVPLSRLNSKSSNLL